MRVPRHGVPRLFIFTSACFLLAAMTHSGPVAAAESLAGEWAGVIETPAGKLEAEITLTHGDESWSGRIDAPGMMASDRDLFGIEVHDGELEAEIDHHGTFWFMDARLTLRLKADQNLLAGEIHQAESGFRHQDVVDGIRLAPAGSERAEQLQALVTPCKPPTEDPMEARLIADDVHNFWQAVDAGDGDFEADAFREHYFANASRGMLDFRNMRWGGVTDFVEALEERRDYYTWLADHRDRVNADLEATIDQIRAGFLAMKSLYPEAEFPHVYFVVGEMNTGGTASECGLLIGAEMRSRADETPVHELSDWELEHTRGMDGMAALVVHELVHFLQDNAERETLLHQAIHEGSADFLAHLATGIRSTSPERDAWADKREAKLWDRFREDMDLAFGRERDPEFANWMYGEPKEEGWPSDLGYWMGYRITRAYFESSGDPYQAVREILNIQDYEAFLEQSGYPDARPGGTSTGQIPVSSTAIGPGTAMPISYRLPGE